MGQNLMRSQIRRERWWLQGTEKKQISGQVSFVLGPPTRCEEDRVTCAWILNIHRCIFFLHIRAFRLDLPQGRVAHAHTFQAPFAAHRVNR